MLRQATRALPRLCLGVALVFVVAGPALAVTGHGEHGHGERRNFDARNSINAGFEAAPLLSQRQAANAFADQVPNLAVDYDLTTGAARTIQSRLGYLTEPAPGIQATDAALNFVTQNLDLLGLIPDDLDDYEITDNVFNRVTGSTHLYLRQRVNGLPLYNGQLHVNVNRDGRVLSVNNLFMPNIAAAIGPDRPALTAPEAVARAARQIGLDLLTSPAIVESASGIDQRTVMGGSGLSHDDIVAKLMWLPVRRGNVRLVWNFQIRTLDNQNWFDFNVDALDGRVWTRFDWVASGGGTPETQRVFELPYESPNHSPVTPPADGRVLVTDEADATASPMGWHDDGNTTYTITRGNNVNAYEDSDGNNAPSTQPDCGAGLTCDFDFPIAFDTQAPASYQDGAVANLFYWNNIIHDVLFQYGFDEAGGNFQETNFLPLEGGGGGVGGDPVQAEAQDPGNCNANFATPPDGGTPRMQMFTCNNTSPAVDGDFDNGVIVHEYGHGISIRQVGGPANSGCLNNTQQPGEGISDWHSLVFTHEVGDAGTDSRGIGTYLFGQPADGPGIRPQPYSTDPLVNDYTYESINGLSIPHGLGSVWAQAIWETYWALVDVYGFDPNIYDPAGGAGNQRMFLYENQGLKNTICGPTFLDMRDGILQAATDNYGGEDVCLLWETFAAFGLGTDAISGGPGSTSPTNGFEIPVECLCEPGQTIPIADAGNDTAVCDGDSVTIGTPGLPGHTYLWSPGGETTPQITVSPTETTDYTVTVTTDCGMKSDTITVFVDDLGIGGMVDDFESGTDNWTFDGLWHLTDDSMCPAPEPGYTSATHAMYYGQDSTCTYNNGGTNAGDMISRTIFGVDESSTLSFEYLRGVESFADVFDVFQAQVLAGGTATTVLDLDSSDPSDPVWTSFGPLSLAEFAGQPIQLRFRFNTNDGQFNDFLGVFLDDIEVTGTSSCSAGGASIFADGFESGDTSAWSVTNP